MASILYPLAIGLLALVAAVLLFGLYNMSRGGSPNLSQRLMRARVLIQFVALIVMMTALYFATR